MWTDLPDSGISISLSGVLYRGDVWCDETDVYCPPNDCCHTCGADAVLVGSVGDVGTDRSIRITGRFDRGQLSCLGDGSIVCCPFDTAEGVRVIITGTLTHDYRSAHQPSLVLDVNGLCRTP